MLDSFISSNMQENNSPAFEWAASVILGQRNHNHNNFIFQGDRQKSDQYLQAVDLIQRSEILSDHQNLIHKTAMETLRSEFRAILTRQTERLEADLLNDRSSAAFSSTITDSFSYEVQDQGHAQEIHDLRRIVERLDAAGNIGDCVQVYRSSRKSVVDSNIQQHGIGKSSVGDMRSLQWELLAPKIKLWIRASRVCFVSLFLEEKNFYEQIFSGLSNFKYDEGFVHIIKESALQLINFAGGVSSTHLSFIKLFEVLDLYQALLDVLPRITDIFHSEVQNSIYVRNEAALAVDLLEKLIRNMLPDFENSVLNELKEPVPGGAIQPLTKYVMNYITRIVGYKETLTGIITSKPTISMISNDDVEFLNVAGKTPLALHLSWIIISLKSNLKAKLDHCKIESLGSLFMMNNVNYIVLKIKGSAVLQEMIGEDHIKKLGEYVSQAADSYIELTWDDFSYCLRDEGLNVRFFCSFQLSKATLRERFKIFNTKFDDVCQAQSAWVVPDSQLRGKLHELILDKLTPAYESFLRNFSSHIETERNSERYIKYKVTDLERAIRKLFPEH